MKQITFFFLISFFISFSSLLAQEFKIPQSVQLDKVEDYQEQESTILEGIEWALSISPNQEAAKQNEFKRFFMRWIEGSPSVTIVLDANMMPFIEKKPDMMLIFMYGWTQASLKQEGKLNAKDGNFHALTAVAEYYEQYNKEIGKNKDLKKFLKLHKQNKLRQFIDKNLE